MSQRSMSQRSAPTASERVGLIVLVVGCAVLVAAVALIGRALITGEPITGGGGVGSGEEIAELEPDEREPVLLPGTDVPLPEVVEEELEPADDAGPEGAVAEGTEETVTPAERENPGVDVAARTAELPEAPQEVIEDCSDFFTGKRDDTMRARMKEGLVMPDFAITFRGLVNPYAMMSTMCLPGETLEVDLHRGDGVYDLSANGGAVSEIEPQRKWGWTLPAEPGIYCLKLKDRESGTNICLHGIVCVPYSGETKLEGYDIGEYKRTPLRENPRYEMPKGMIRVGREDMDTWVSPHLQLRQFVCKQPSAYPKFLLLEARMLLKLEAVIAKLEASGIEPDTLYITSGYRTPYYNASLGNKTSYSRHLYGDAADLFVDMDGDYRLDDLNRDGLVNDRDALYLSSLIDSVSDHLPEHFTGGIGFYGFLSSRTAFVHTDTRGYSARWGFRTGKEGPAPKEVSTVISKKDSP